jgi:hypothetical protein
MFAELEVITDRTSRSVVAIPSTAVVAANGKKIVYVENGDKFQGVDVTLGRATGDFVEVKTGLFAGDRIVSQRGMLLYAQSLRGGSATDDHAHEETQLSTTSNPLTTPWVWMATGTIATVGAVILWRRRRSDGGKFDLVDERFNEEEIDTILTGILEETELPALPPIEEPALKTRSE